MKKQRNVILSLLLCVVLVASTLLPAYAAPGTVKKLQVSAVTANAVSLKWAKVSGAKGYEVQQSTGSGWQSAAVTSKTSAKITGLRLGTTYRFRVRAYQSTKRGVTYGAVSSAVSATAAPTVKTLKVSAKTSNALTLKWTNVSGATGYRLQKYVNKQWVNVLKSTKKTSYTVKKLAPNTAYRFRVCAFQGSVFGAYKTLKTRTDLLQKPAGLKATKVKDTSLTLKWNKVPTATTYFVYKVGTNTQKRIGQTTKTSFAVTGLKPAGDYIYAVRARTVVNDRNYYSQYSSNLSVRTAPKQATGLAVAGTTDDAVNLRYSKVAGAEGYEIWQYDNAKLKWIYIGASETTTYTVGDLAPQSSYRFKIRAYHTVNGTKLCGAYSAEVTAQTLMAPVSGLQFDSATGTTLVLSWTPISTASGYRVEMHELDETAAKTVNTTPALVSGRMQATIASLKENTAYVVSVRPLYGTAIGTEQTLVAKTAPAKPQNVKANKATGGISLSWPAVAGAEGYEVSKFMSGSNWKTIGYTPDCSFADSDVITDTSYTYRVRAYYQIGDTKCFGEPSDPVSEKPMPGAVTGLAASDISETMFLLRWNTPGSTTSYRITCSEDGGAERTLPDQVTISGATTSLQVSGLTAGASYTVKIYNTVNDTQSLPATITVTTMPAKVTGLSAAANGADAVVLNWTAVRGAERYEVQRGSASGADFVTVATNAMPPYTVTGLAASTEYTFRVRAANSNSGIAQTGVFSDAVKGKTNAGSVTPGGPVAPTNLQAQDTSSGTAYSVKLTWSGVNGASGYSVSINDGSWRELGNTTTTNYTATSLTAGKTYSFYVRSYTGSGSTAVYSNPSNTASVTVGGGSAPSTPSTPATDLPTSNTPLTNLTVKADENGRNYTVRWSDVSGGFYTVQMLDPKTNQWVTVRERLTTARVSPDIMSSDLSISCTPGSDQATTVSWSAYSGATSYEVRNEVVMNTNEWVSKVRASGTSATLRLPPNSEQRIRVSAIGNVKFRIYALNSAGTSCLAYSEYTAQNVYLTSCDYTYRTLAAPSFSSGASAGVKEAYALMLTQAINNTRMETGRVTMNAVTSSVATASMMGVSDSFNNSKTISCTYQGGTGTATVTATENGKTTGNSSNFSMLQTIIVPSDGRTYLYDQHNLSTFQNYVDGVSVSTSGDKTVVTLTLKQESVTTGKDLVYHPSLVGSAVTAEGLQDQIEKESAVRDASASVGASTIKATINSSYTLDALEISNPYSLTVKSTVGTINSPVKLTYNYTFTR